MISDNDHDENLYDNDIFEIHNNDTQQQKHITNQSITTFEHIENRGFRLARIDRPSRNIFHTCSVPGIEESTTSNRRTVVATTTKNHKSCVIVLKLVGVFVRITHKIHHTERRGTVRICIHGFCAWQVFPVCCFGYFEGSFSFPHGYNLASSPCAARCHSHAVGRRAPLHLQYNLAFTQTHVHVTGISYRDLGGTSEVFGQFFKKL